MGYIALEMCEAFEKRGINTSMVKPGSIFLPWLSSDLADVIYQELIHKGIHLYSGKTGRLLGAQMVGKEGVAHRINAVAVALHAKMTVDDFFQTDLAYAPPFGPVWDPLLTAASQLAKKNIINTRPNRLKG